MSVFISHAHVDRVLADGLKTLISDITSGTIPVWFSSETRAGGGMESGEYRKQIWTQIKKAKTILVIITPQSSERPWLVWESGFAEGRKKEVMPVLFWIEKKRIHSVYQNHQVYQGSGEDSLTSITKMIELVIKTQSGQTPDDKKRNSWAPQIEQFLEEVEKEQQESEERTLFHDHFHTQDTAEKMSGKWLAQWTKILANGKEKDFEADSLRVWSDETRIRMVGDGAKGKPYPMEGVVSPIGQIALSYWSEGDTAICGTVLLRPLGGNIASDLVGTWQGFTAKKLRFAELKYVRGRVVMTRLPKMATGKQIEEAEAFLKEALKNSWDWVV